MRRNYVALALHALNSAAERERERDPNPKKTNKNCRKKRQEI